jgi:hypothetical protein
MVTGLPSGVQTASGPNTPNLIRSRYLDQARALINGRFHAHHWKLSRPMAYAAFHR